MGRELYVEKIKYNAWIAFRLNMKPVPFGEWGGRGLPPKLGRFNLFNVIAGHVPSVMRDVTKIPGNLLFSETFGTVDNAGSFVFYATGFSDIENK